MAGKLLVLGTNGFVAGMDEDTGEEVWRTSLSGYGLVNVLWQRGRLFAASQGRLYRLNPRNGEVIWENNLPGMGYEPISLALEGASTGETLAAQAKYEADRGHDSHT